MQQPERGRNWWSRQLRALLHWPRAAGLTLRLCRQRCSSSERSWQRSWICCGSSRSRACCLGLSSLQLRATEAKLTAGARRTASHRRRRRRCCSPLLQPSSSGACLLPPLLAMRSNSRSWQPLCISMWHRCCRCSTSTRQSCARCTCSPSSLPGTRSGSCRPACQACCLGPPCCCRTQRRSPGMLRRRPGMQLPQWWEVTRRRCLCSPRCSRHRWRPTSRHLGRHRQSNKWSLLPPSLLPATNGLRRG